MIKGDITYGDLTSIVLDYILTKCENIGDSNDAIKSKFDAEFLPGYSSSKKEIPHDGGTKFIPKYHYTSIDSTAITSVKKSTIENEFKTYLKDNGLSSADTIIPTNDLYHTFNLLITFCCCKMCFKTSQFKTKKHLVYKQTAIGDRAYKRPDEFEYCDYDIIEALDVSSIIKILITTLNTSIRYEPVRYNINFTA
jgi:hypothetical protein